MQACMTTSWDDGHPLDLRVAEMLARHGLRGTFYVPRKASTGTLSEPQLRQLAQNFDVEAHTIHHVDLTTIDVKRASQEIGDSRAWVQDVTGRECSLFCPPLGHFTARHLRMIRDAGYRGIRTVEFLSLDRPRTRAGLLEMPTTLQAHPNGRASYARNLAKRVALRNLWLYVRHGASGDWFELARRLLAAVACQGGVFHLWGHSWELESAGQWTRLDQVFGLMSQGAATMARVTNAELCAGAAVPIRH
jgi:hypothetical protein